MFEPRLLPSSPVAVQQVEIPLQTSAAKNTVFLLPQASRGLSSPEKQYGNISHPLHNYLFLRLSSRWMWLRDGAPASIQLPFVKWRVYLEHAEKDVALVTLAPDHEVMDDVNGENFSLLLPFCQVSAQHLEWKGHSEGSLLFFLPPASEAGSNILWEDDIGEKGRRRP